MFLVKIRRHNEQSRYRTYREMKATTLSTSVTSEGGGEVVVQGVGMDRDDHYSRAEASRHTSESQKIHQVQKIELVCELRSHRRQE